MIQKRLTLLLDVGCVALGIAGFLIYSEQDHNAPEITIEKKEITYIEGDSYEQLLEGVSAEDERDGDLGSEVFVDKIIPMENGKATVYYGVMDKHNNVGTAKRTVNYIPVELENDDPASEGQKDINSQNPEEENPDTEQDKKEKTDEDGKKEAENTDEEEKKDELKPDGEKPAIALTKKKMTIKAGESFDVLSVVKDAVDDKDDKSTLYQHIHADGNYNTKTKGTYKITYYVTDSDGNASEKQVFTLTVK